MPKQWIVGCLMLVSVLALAACMPANPEHSLAPKHTLARDGGTRLTLRAACLPSAPDCDLAKQRAAAMEVLRQRLEQSISVNDPIVRGDGAADIVVELPGVTSHSQVADITTLLTTSGAVAVLDTGDTPLPTGTNVAGQTCLSTCAADQYRIMFTGDQIDRAQVGVQQDTAHGGTWLVQFAFAGSARKQFADYTASHIGQYLTIAANDVVVESATIQSEIDATAQISGMNEAEAKQLAADLKSGALPATLTVLTTEQAQPSGS